MKNAEKIIDLNSLSGTNQIYNVSVSNSETLEDGNARRALAAAAAAQQQRIQFAVVLFSLFVTSIIFIGCIVIFATGSADDKKWTAAVVSSITSGLIGFLVGQGNKK